MEIFKTERAVLRSLSLCDFDVLRDMMADVDVMRFTGFKEPQSEEEVKELLEKWILEGQKELGVWGAVCLQSGFFLGWFMLKKTICQDPELGFMISRHKWGQGYATEISRGFLEYAFQTLKVERVLASVNVANTPSLNVLKKIGMREAQDIPVENNIMYFEALNEGEL